MTEQHEQDMMNTVNYLSQKMKELENDLVKQRTQIDASLKALSDTEKFLDRLIVLTAKKSNTQTQSKTDKKTLPSVLQEVPVDVPVASPVDVPVVVPVKESKVFSSATKSPVAVFEKKSSSAKSPISLASVGQQIVQKSPAKKQKKKMSSQTFSNQAKNAQLPEKMPSRIQTFAYQAKNAQLKKTIKTYNQKSFAPKKMASGVVVASVKDRVAFFQSAFD